MSGLDETDALGRLADGAAGPETREVEASGVDAEDAGHIDRAAEAFARVLTLAPEEIAALLDTETADPAPLPAPDLPEDYELIGELGRGGMGIVFEARQRSLDRNVAIKILRPGELLFGQALKRFQKEARLLARLRHPHIVRIYEVGERNGQVYYTMDLIRGQSMAELLREGRMTAARMVKLLRQVASAVAYVHEHGLIHRDLKPANILIDENGDAVVTDFGLALEIGGAGDMTLTGQVLGTPAYMSPEQARGNTAAVGESTDVYAMGVILYECLTGRRPFEGISPAEQVYAVIHRDPPPPRKVDSNVPPDLDLICQKAMRKRAEHRYPTARALLEDLERFDEGRSVSAKPLSRAYRLGRLVRRQRLPFALSAAAMGLLLFAVLGVMLPRVARYEASLIEIAEELMAKNQPEAAAVIYERAVELGGGDPDWPLFEGWGRAHLAAASERIIRGDLTAADTTLDRIDRRGGGQELFAKWDGSGRALYLRAVLGAARGDEGAQAALIGSRRIWQRRMHSWDWYAHVHLDRPTAPPFSEGPTLRALLLDEAVRAIQSQDPAAGRGGWAQLRAIALNPVWGMSHLERDLVVRLGPTWIGEIIKEVTLSRHHPKHGLYDLGFVRNGLRDLNDPRVARHLAAVLDDARASLDVKRVAAHLLADLADLPAFDALPGQDPSGELRDPAGVRSAWLRVAGLEGVPALRERLLIARDAAERLSPSPHARPLLTRWTQRHTSYSYSEGTGHKAILTALERAAADPAAELRRAIGFGADPGAASGALLTRMGNADDVGKARIHHLLSITAKHGWPPPIWGTSGGTPAGLVRTWRARLANSPDVNQMRWNELVLDGNRWIIDPDTEQQRGVVPDQPVKIEVKSEAPADTAADLGRVHGRLHGRVPGFPGGAAWTMNAGVVQLTSRMAGQIRWSNDGLAFTVLSASTLKQGPGFSSRASSGGGTVLAAYACSPSLITTSFSRRDDLRHHMTLAVFEDANRADDEPWPLERWRQRLTSDLERLAAALEVARRDDVASQHGAYAAQGTLANILAIASRIPLPDARASLQRIAVALATGVPQLGSYYGPMTFHARLIAGDSAALDEPNAGRLASALGGADHSVHLLGSHGRAWSRLALITGSERIRAFAFKQLGDAPQGSDVREDLRMLRDRGDVQLPVNLSRSLDTEPRPGALLDWWSRRRSEALLVALNLLLLALALLGTLRPRRRRRQRLRWAGSLATLALLSLCYEATAGGLYLPPSALSHVALAVASWVLGREASAKRRRTTALAFAGAATVGFASLALGQPTGLVVLQGALGAVGIIGLAMISGHLRRPGGAALSWWFRIFYVAPVALFYALMLAGALGLHGLKINLSEGTATALYLGLAVSLLLLVTDLWRGIAIRTAVLRLPKLPAR